MVPTTIEELLHFAPFPRRLAAAMALRGLSSRALSRETGSEGVSHAAICNYLNGKQVPRIPVVCMLAAALDITPACLMPRPGLDQEDREWMDAALGPR